MHLALVELGINGFPIFARKIIVDGDHGPLCLPTSEFLAQTDLILALQGGLLGRKQAFLAGFGQMWRRNDESSVAENPGTRGLPRNSTQK